MEREYFLKTLQDTRQEKKLPTASTIPTPEQSSSISTLVTEERA